MSTVLTILQRAARRIGIPEPTEALASTDTATKQLLDISREVCDDLVTRFPWKALETRHTLTGDGTEDYALPTDYSHFPRRARLWDTTIDDWCYGPLSTLEWDRVKVTEIANSSLPYWSLIGAQINIYPAPSSAKSFVITYQSKSWCVKASDSARADDWEADDDTTVLDDELVRLGIVWRWKEAKGFDYAEAMANFERRFEIVSSNDHGPRVISTSAPPPLPDNWFPGRITV